MKIIAIVTFPDILLDGIRIMFGYSLFQIILFFRFDLNTDVDGNGVSHRIGVFSIICEIFGIDVIIYLP